MKKKIIKIICFILGHKEDCRFSNKTNEFELYCSRCGKILYFKER